jgi:hypothetical protein
LCVAPGEFSGCGFCVNQRPCSSDGDCAVDAGWPSLPPYGGPICEDPSLRGLCGGCYAQKLCLTACRGDGDCVGGRVCSATGHCVWRSCSTTTDCPANFACTSGQCQRLSCTVDADCPAGFCVNDGCYAAYGTCMPAPI